MAPVKKGNRVKVFYTGKLKDGSVFETNFNKTPLEFSVGKGKVIKGFETAVLGMNVGQIKTVTLKPDEAYGQKDPALLWTVPASEFPADTLLETGKEVILPRSNGMSVEGRIIKIEEGQVTVDGNHPLAGRSLTFEIKLLGVS